MKKLAKPTGEIRLKGRAEKDGVALRAAAFLGPLGFSPPGALATVTENGDITCSLWVGNNPMSITHAKIEKFSQAVIWVAGILAILFLGTYFTLSVLTETSYNILFILSYILMSVIWLPKAVGIFVARIFGNQEIKSFSKFLAAKMLYRMHSMTLVKFQLLRKLKPTRHFLILAIIFLGVRQL